MLRRGSRLLLQLALLATSAHAWISVSQALYGAKLDDLRAATRRQSSLNADKSLGWLWSAPRSTTDARGLGQSITWAWDPRLCDMLLPAFRSDAFGIPLINCGTIKATMHRAFLTWSQVRACRAHAGNVLWSACARPLFFSPGHGCRHLVRGPTATACSTPPHPCALCSARPRACAEPPAN